MSNRFGFRQAHHGWVSEVACTAVLGKPFVNDEIDIGGHQQPLDPPLALPWNGKLPPDTLLAKGLRAVFDTGATDTFMSRNLADAVGLESVTSTSVQTPDGWNESRLYHASLWLPNNVAFPFLRIGDMKDDRDDLLIGMDIIGQGNFSIAYDPGDHRTAFLFSLYPEHYPDSESGRFLLADDLRHDASTTFGD